MTRHLQTFITTIFLCLLVAASSIEAAEKWSRQLESTSPGVADTFDWVPLAQPVDGSGKDRSSNGRVLTYSQSFPPNGRFGELSKGHNPPVPQQQTFDFPYQFQRFANPQPQAQSLRQQVSPFTAQLKQGGSSLHSQEPTSQSFFKFEMPYHSEGGNRPAGGPPTLQTGYQISHGFGGGAQGSLYSSSLYNQQPVFPPEFHPIPQKSLHQKPLSQQNFIEDTYPIKNTFRESKPQPTQQSLQAVTPQVFPVDPQPEQIYELNKPSSFQSQPSFSQGVSASAAGPSSASATVGNQGQQDVQLLYVPYDTLYNQQQKPNPSYEVNKYNVNPGLPAVNPYQINQFYTQDPLAQLEPNFYTTSTTSRPRTTTLKQATVFQDFGNSQFTTTKPKPKAHQPPLAMFLLQKSARPTQSDIVSTLRNAHTIAVIDAPTKQTPEIFVGPSGMPIPEGYVKFDLPYLSQLTQSRDLREVPFFVAPLSYRTPNGFNKILLPEPHVGSIVVNRAKDNVGITQPPQQNVVYMTPTQNDISQYQTSTSRPRPSGQRNKQPSSSKDYFSDVLKNQNQFDITTQRATLQPSRGNKFSYFYDQDAIHEVTSPKITKHDRPKKKRPQNVQIEQPAFTQQPNNNHYAQFEPTPNQITNDEYYKIQPNKPRTTSSTSTSTSTSTTSTTSTTAEPPAYFTYSTSPQVEFQSTNGQLYHNFNTATEAPTNVPEEYVPRFTTRPPPVTSAEEEFRMKQYFRQQDAFRNRPHSTHPTNSPYEQVQYTPVSLDYDREVTIPSSTQKSTTPTKQRITYYTPTEPPTTAPEENYNTAPPQEQVFEYNRAQSARPDLQSNKKLPSNHRPSFNQNEIPDSTVEYEPNPYQLPSELPPLTPNLPGLVNNLQDKHNAIENSAGTTPTQQETEQPTRPTRRPINRVRKPVVKVTSSVSYSESESTSKRPPQRVRRPYGSRGSASSTAPADTDNDSTSTTRRPSSAARNPLIRNPNRIRYQPSPEERNTLRIKPRKPYNGSKKASETEDLEYQRDVLKQNYPVFKPGGSRTPTSPTAIPSSYAGITNTEGPSSEGTQQVYTVTPSNNIDNNEQTFPAGLLEPMQIAQQYNKYSKDNYGPGYFPNQEDLNPTEPILKNEISPVYTTLSTSSPSTTTTTTEEPQITTRRSPFVRRNYPRLRTTTEAPTTTTPVVEEKPSVRSRLPPRKVIKVRARTRRPTHPASSTTVPAEEAEHQEPKTNYRKLNRFNQDLYENDTPRRRYKPQFHLDGQESQWSPAVKLSNNNNFKPLNPKEKRIENQHKFENEPEIVTISPDAEDDVKEKKSDTFEVNVSANFGSEGTETKTTLKEPNLKPEKSFAELLEEVMGKAPNERPLDTENSNTKTTDGTYFESQKTTIGSRFNRRGKWKKTGAQAAHNNESFETAESQNIGAQLFNSLYSGSSNNGEQQQKSTEEMIKELKATTPMTPDAATQSLPAITTSAPQTTTTMDEYDMTTRKQQPEITTIASTLTMDGEDNNKATTVNVQQADTTEESATRRIDAEDLSSGDDLETQPSLFSEVRKQLHELFAIEDNDDQAVTAALAAVGRRRQEYTNIKRVKTETTIAPPQAAAAAETATATTEPTVTGAADGKKEFHKNLMDQVVYATSTSTKVTSETEICYRGRCIRSEDLPSNHKLN